MRWSPKYCEVRDDKGKLLQRTVQHTENGPIELLFPFPGGFVDSKINPIKREWVGLTDEEIRPLCAENHIIFGAYTVDFINAIEAKLREKNT